jgi:hypothetical protein
MTVSSVWFRYTAIYHEVSWGSRYCQPHTIKFRFRDHLACSAWSEYSSSNQVRAMKVWQPTSNNTLGGVRMNFLMVVIHLMHYFVVYIWIYKSILSHLYTTTKLVISYRTSWSCHSFDFSWTHLLCLLPRCHYNSHVHADYKLVLETFKTSIKKTGSCPRPTISVTKKGQHP